MTGVKTCALQITSSRELQINIALVVVAPSTLRAIVDRVGVVQAALPGECPVIGVMVVVPEV